MTAATAVPAVAAGRARPVVPAAQAGGSATPVAMDPAAWAVPAVKVAMVVTAGPAGIPVAEHMLPAAGMGVTDAAAEKAGQGVLAPREAPVMDRTVPMERTERTGRRADHLRRFAFDMMVNCDRQLIHASVRATPARLTADKVSNYRKRLRCIIIRSTQDSSFQRNAPSR